MTNCSKHTVPELEGRLLNRFTMDSCSNGVSEVELQFNTAQLAIKVQISAIVLFIENKFDSPKKYHNYCNFKFHKEMTFYQSSTTIYPGEMHFFFVKTLWNTLCPLVIPSDCQAVVQVV